MLRFCLTTLLLLLTGTAVNAGGAQQTPVPWRAVTPSTDTVPDTSAQPAVLSVEQISLFLAQGEKPPSRSFDEEVDPVVSVGLSDEERAYLRKKPSEAFLRSAVLPGWGQRYGERNLRGAIFTGAEVALWTGLLLTRQTWLEGEDDYMTFARQHAGVTGPVDHQYYVDIGNYDTMTEFNEAQRQQRQYADQYRSSADYWEWDSSRNRETFKDIRIEADQAKNRIYYFVGGLVLNRILASIDASRGLHNRQEDLREKQAGLSFAVGYNSELNAPSLMFTW